MEVAPVNADGSVFLSYIDSGPVEGSEDYTTVVCMHGFGFNAESFRPLLKAGKNYNLRIIALNRRGYRGSTPYAPPEMEIFYSDHPEDFFRPRAEEMARFLIHIVRRLCIPKRSGDCSKGGLALFGWSAGNIYVLSFLALAETLSQETRDILEPYMAGVIMFDCTFLNIGIPPPTNPTYILALDSSIPQADRPRRVGMHIATHFNHPNPLPPSCACQDIQSRIPRDIQTHNPDEKRESRTGKPPTLIPSEEMKVMCEGNRSPSAPEMLAALRIPKEKLWEISRRAFLLNAPIFTGVRVVNMYGLETIWECVWAGWCLEREINRVANDEGAMTRPFQSVPISGANHFFHWEDPNHAAQLIASCLGS